MGVILDSSEIIALERNRGAIENLVAGREDEPFGISVVTVAELLHGAEKSADVPRNLRVVEDFCSRLDVLPYGVKAAQHYGSIRATLERRGQPIGVNDLHIAAHARSEGLTLVTNNLAEFERVPGLLTENWVGSAG